MIKRRTDSLAKLIIFIIGILFSLLGLIMYILPLFFEVKKDFTEQWYLPLIITTFGIVIAYKPELLISKFSKASDKVIDKQ